MALIPEPVGFQRARRPEQREVRRRAILDAAQELLGELPAADISLREIARRLGGSKSGIVRYYETREALFLELLNRACQEWLDELELRLPAPTSSDADADVDVDVDELVTDIAAVWARSLAERPVLCELWSLLAAVLERNASPEVIRDFKLGNHEQLSHLAHLIAERLPGLDHAAAVELVDASVVVIIGLWPFANPTPEIVEAIDDPRLTSAHVDFAESFSRTVRVLITGLLHVGSA